MYILFLNIREFHDSGNEYSVDEYSDFEYSAGEYAPQVFDHGVMQQSSCLETLRCNLEWGVYGVE